MTLALLKVAIDNGDAPAVRQIAIDLISKLSPEGHLLALARVAQAKADLAVIDANFDIDKHVTDHLGNETLISVLEDGFAKTVPSLVQAAGPVTAYVIPMLSALVAPPGSTFLNLGLQIACKVTLLALTEWSNERMKYLK